MSRIADATILITGGASGLGKALAELFLKHGAARLIIWDANRTKLDLLLDRLSRYDAHISGHVLDVGDPGLVQEIALKLAAGRDHVDILVNNAGSAPQGYFADHSHKDITDALRINAAGPMYCTLCFLPGMISRKRGHIVNISSAAGVVPVAGLAVYGASKCALTCWSEALQRELSLIRSGIRVTLANPGHMDTAMFKDVCKPFWMPTLDPEQVAARIIRAVKNDHLNLTMPFLVRMGGLARALLPARVFQLLSGRILGLDRFIKRPGERNDSS